MKKIITHKSEYNFCCHLLSISLFGLENAIVFTIFSLLYCKLYSLNLTHIKRFNYIYSFTAVCHYKSFNGSTVNRKSSIFTQLFRRTCARLAFVSYDHRVILAFFLNYMYIYIDVCSLFCNQILFLFRFFNCCNCYNCFNGLWIFQ